MEELNPPKPKANLGRKRGEPQGTRNYSTAVKAKISAQRTIREQNKKIIKGKFKTKDEARAEWSQMEDRGSLKIEDDQKHYTSVLEKALRRAALENNSEVVTVKVKMDNKWVDAFGIKFTPEMLLPHKTHRKDGGMVYTPELIDIFEAA